MDNTYREEVELVGGPYDGFQDVISFEADYIHEYYATNKPVFYDRTDRKTKEGRTIFVVEKRERKRA